MSRRITLGPFNRVEGDLEVKIEVDNAAVTGAWVNSPLYRGFEQILVGKDPRDALAYAPRICGICSVSQSMAGAYALADAQTIDMPPNGELATNLILAAENLADHFTHFYLFFMPDFARAVYAETAARFRAVAGTAAREALPARAQLLHLMGILAGKWPHSLALQPGGSTRSTDTRDKVRLLAAIAGFRRFLEERTFGDSLETIAALDSEAALRAWLDGEVPVPSHRRLPSAPSAGTRHGPFHQLRQLSGRGRTTLPSRRLGRGCAPVPRHRRHYRGNFPQLARRRRSAASSGHGNHAPGRRETGRLHLVQGAATRRRGRRDRRPRPPGGRRPPPDQRYRRR